MGNLGIDEVSISICFCDMYLEKINGPEDVKILSYTKKLASLRVFID